MLYIEVLDNHPPPRRVNTISCLLNKLFYKRGISKDTLVRRLASLFFFLQRAGRTERKSSTPDSRSFRNRLFSTIIRFDSGLSSGKGAAFKRVKWGGATY